MDNSILLILVLSTLRLSLPIMFAAVGGYFSEKSGVAQIGLEAYLLIGAFTAAATAYFTKSILLSYLVAALVALIFSQIFSVLTIFLKSNSIVTGTALNLLAMGLIPITSKVVFNSTGSTPTLDFTDSLNTYLPYGLFVAIFLISYWLSEKTAWGLQFKFAGEKKAALQGVGISSEIRQWQAVNLTAVITSLGGAMLSTSLASSYSPLMSSGRGFIALAALIFAGWRLMPTVFVCLAFGFCEALQIVLQANEGLSKIVAAEFIQTLPYIATLIALVFLKNKTKAPAELS